MFDRVSSSDSISNMKSLFPKHSHVQAFFSERSDGSMRLAGLTGVGDGAPDPINQVNRTAFFEKMGLGEKKIVSAQLVHGNKVVFVDKDSPEYIHETDGLITTESDVALTITSADCFPVYLYDEKRGMIGLAHVGWQGAVKGVVTKMLQMMEESGSVAQDIEVAIGPGICQKHYAIPEERVPFCSDYSQALSEIDGKTYLDIKKIIIQQLESGGVEHIARESDCTFESPEKYFSYRRDKPAILEVHVAGIVLV